MSNKMNEDIYKIKCSKCEQLPLFDFNFDNQNNLIIKYKCHNENFEKFYLNQNFINEPFKCEICGDKKIKKCICGFFCKDDYLYHILISKHNLNKIKIENIKDFKYYCNNCDKILDMKNEEHNNHDLINYQKYILKVANFGKYFFENISKIKQLNQINLLCIIYYNSLYNLKEGYYRYLNNLENLIIKMIYYFKDNKIIDNKNNELNYIISNYSNKDINKNLQILNNNDNKLNKELEEKCEIYLNQK